MKFITEEELRIRYRKEPFTRYLPEPEARLTPGARQFLNDKGIRILEPAMEKTESGLAKEVWKHQLFSLQAEFLKTGQELLEYDVQMAQEVFELERQLAEAGKTEPERNQTDRSIFQYKEAIFPACAGITSETCGVSLEDCFEITGFHAQAPRGREIIRLHCLRCAARELEAQLPDSRKEAVNRVINRLSQMICQLFGGKICYRKQHLQSATESSAILNRQ